MKTEKQIREKFDSASQELNHLGKEKYVVEMMGYLRALEWVLDIEETE